LQDLQNNNIILHDIDFTQDFKGELRYKEFNTALTKNYETVDNQKYNGRNQITFITPQQHRLKFYSKIIANIETSSVRESYGT
jgi:hypothetical protein